MSGGERPREAGQVRQAAGALGRGRSERDKVGGAGAMQKARLARALQPRFGLRARTLAAMQAAAAIGHGRLAAGAARARARAAARRRGEVAGRIAVVEAARLRGTRFGGRAATRRSSGGAGGRGGRGCRAVAGCRAVPVAPPAPAPAQHDHLLAGFAGRGRTQSGEREQAEAVAFHEPAGGRGEARGLEAHAPLVRRLGRR